MKKIVFALLLFAAPIAAQKINPNTQIRWPLNCNTGANMVYNPQSNTCVSTGSGMPGVTPDGNNGVNVAGMLTAARIGPSKVACGGIVAPGPPTLAIFVSSGGTGPGTGAYQYAVSFENAYGGTVAGTTASITTANATSIIRLTNIPTGPTGTTQRTLWRTTANGQTLRWLDVIADNTTTTYTDGTATDASLSLQTSPFINTTCNTNAAGTSTPYINDVPYNAMDKPHTWQIGPLGSPFHSTGQFDQDFIANATVDFGATYNLAKHTEGDFTVPGNGYGPGTGTTITGTVVINGITLTNLATTSFYSGINANGAFGVTYTVGQQYKFSYFAYSMQPTPMLVYARALSNSGVDGWGAHLLQPHVLTRISFDCVAISSTQVDCGSNSGNNGDLSGALGSGTAASPALAFLFLANPFIKADYHAGSTQWTTNIYVGGMQVEAIPTDKIAAIVQGDSKTAVDCASSAPWDTIACSSPWRYAEAITQHPFLIRGHGGYTCTSLAPLYATEVHPYIANAKYYIIDCGVNDLSANSSMTPAASASAIETQIQTMTGYAQADGIPNIVVTTIPPTSKDVMPQTEEARQLVNAWIFATYPNVIDLAKPTADYFDPRLIVRDPNVFPAVDGTHELNYGRELEGEYIAQHSCGNTLGLPPIFCWKQPSPYQPVLVTTPTVGQLRVAGVPLGGGPTGTPVITDQVTAPQIINQNSKANGSVDYLGLWTGTAHNTGYTAYISTGTASQWNPAYYYWSSDYARHWGRCTQQTSSVTTPPTGCNDDLQISSFGTSKVTIGPVSGGINSQTIQIPNPVNPITKYWALYAEKSVATTLTVDASLQFLQLGGSTTLTIAGTPNGGYPITVEVCQAASGGPYTVTWPANFRGGPAVTTTNGQCTVANFVYETTNSQWVYTGGVASE